MQFLHKGLQGSKGGCGVVLGEEVSAILLSQLRGSGQVRAFQPETDVLAERGESRGRLEIYAVAILYVYLLFLKLLHERDEVVQVLRVRIVVDV